MPRCLHVSCLLLQLSLILQPAQTLKDTDKLLARLLHPFREQADAQHGSIKHSKAEATHKVTGGSNAVHVSHIVASGHSGKATEASIIAAAKATAVAAVSEELRKLGLVNSKNLAQDVDSERSGQHRPADLDRWTQREAWSTEKGAETGDQAKLLEAAQGAAKPQGSGLEDAVVLPFACLRSMARGVLMVVEPLYEALTTFLQNTNDMPTTSGSTVPLETAPDTQAHRSARIPVSSHGRVSGNSIDNGLVNDEHAELSWSKERGGQVLKGQVKTSANSGVNNWQVTGRSGSIARPDPIGISAGVILLFYAVFSVFKYRREANRIISLFEANTQIKELSEKAGRGEPLPNIVVIRGHVASDGGDIGTVSTNIEGLRERVGQIEQPKNAWIEIARQAKSDPQLRPVADAVVQRTGVDDADVPDVPEPGDPFARQSASTGSGSLVVAEILVARICAKHQSVKKDKATNRVTIKRPRRNESYNCFHGRRVSEGLHIIDLDGTRAEIELPPADAVGLAGVPDPPPLFLPVSDVWTEFTHYLRKDGVTGPSGRRQRLDDLPPMRLSDPYTLLSEFIFVDVQSPGDLGGFPGNPGVLGDIAEAYRSSQGPAKFLWEPRGFYDSVRAGSYDDLPAYANIKYKRTEMVGASELIERAQAAAKENSRYTPHCEPTFSRSELEQRRDQENCFRYTELAIPRGTPVTILAKPMIAEAGTGEGAECRVRLVSPVAYGDGADDCSEDPKADRFRFRILKGHQVENLLRYRELNPTAYYGLGVLSIAFISWAACGYPGLSA